MPDDKPKSIKKNIEAPKKSQESVDAPGRFFGGSQDVAPLGTNASGTPVSGKPKKN